MNILDKFFNPKSIALIGASDKEGSVGRIILENLLLGKEFREIYPVNPFKKEILGLKCYPSVRSIPKPIDLAIIAVPSKIVPDVLRDCGVSDVKAVIIISAGFGEVGEEGRKLEEKIKEIAKTYGIRIIGPNCMGIIRPKVKLNTTFSKIEMKDGNIAFLSQSGALGTAVLEWARSRGIGFSVFVSVGSMIDIDFGDLIDYLGQDPNTSSIIIYMESIGNAKKFICAARGFARTKPIIVLKPGKSLESMGAATRHIGAIVSEDKYYDAVFFRAGVVRVDEVKDLFNCATLLGMAKLPKGPNLAIITNAGGPAVVATDALIMQGGKLAELSSKTLSKLDEVLPHYWSKGNPVDIGDTDPYLYEKALAVCLEDPNVDGIIVIYTPQGGGDPIDIARMVIEYSKKTDKPILTAWMGEGKVQEARDLLHKNNIPSYEFPEEAVKAYMYLHKYAKILEALYETPEELPVDLAPPKNHLRLMIKRALKEGRFELSEEESKSFLKAYGISTTTPYIAQSPEEAVSIASELGYPVVMKVSCIGIPHKSDVGGVVLNLRRPEEVKEAYQRIIENVSKCKPDVKINGVSIEKMVTNYYYRIDIHSMKDEIFGPIIFIGLGGVEGDIVRDFGVGLPPLNQTLARRMLEQTKFYRLLKEGFRGKPPINMRLIEETLVKFSNLVVDFPEIKEIRIDPLVIDEKSVTAVDARILLDPTIKNSDNVREYSHLIITPYPTRYVQIWRCRDGTEVLIRPIRPEDEPLHEALIKSLSEASMRARFFTVIKEITHEMLVRFCNIDYDREIAIVAEYNDVKGKRIVGVGRLILSPGRDTGEFALLVADDFQGKGLGLKLLDMLIGIARDKKLKSMFGITLATNKKMINLARRLGFKIERISPDEVKITVNLE